MVERLDRCAPLVAPWTIGFMDLLRGPVYNQEILQNGMAHNLTVQVLTLYDTSKKQR